MNDPIGRISRRRFLVLLAGGLGVGTTAWRLGSRPAPLAVAPTAPPISHLPPVPTGAPLPTTAATVDHLEAAQLAGASRTIDVLCRDAWGALPIAGSLTPHVPVRMTVHHTATLLTDHATAPSYVRDHQVFHQRDRGWSDLAYHFIIDDAGLVYEGRPVDAVGDTATDYDPTGHLLIACEGNFEEQDVPAAQLASLVDLLAWGAAAYDIDPATITGHRDWASTACPGAGLYARVVDGSLARSVEALIADGGAVINSRCGPEAAAVVAAIEQDVEPESVPDLRRANDAE